MAKNDQRKLPEISKSIPELDESDKEIATCEESKNWAKNTTKVLLQRLCFTHEKRHRTSSDR